MHEAFKPSFRREARILHRLWSLPASSPPPFGESQPNKFAVGAEAPVSQDADDRSNGVSTISDSSNAMSSGKEHHHSTSSFDALASRIWSSVGIGFLDKALNTLQPTRWNNDEVIQGSLATFAFANPDWHVFDTNFLLPGRASSQLGTRSAIRALDVPKFIISLHLGNNHWTVVIGDMKTVSFYLIDPVQDDFNFMEARILLEEYGAAWVKQYPHRFSTPWKVMKMVCDPVMYMKNKKLRQQLAMCKAA